MTKKQKTKNSSNFDDNGATARAQNKRGMKEK